MTGLAGVLLLWEVDIIEQRVEDDPPLHAHLQAPAEEPAGDDFATAEPATGGIETAGREKRESIDFESR